MHFPFVLSLWPVSTFPMLTVSKEEEITQKEPQFLVLRDWQQSIIWEFTLIYCLCIRPPSLSVQVMGIRFVTARLYREREKVNVLPTTPKIKYFILQKIRDLKAKIC